MREARGWSRAERRRKVKKEVAINPEQLEAIYQECRFAHRNGKSGPYRVEIYYDLETGDAWCKPSISEDSWTQYAGDVICVAKLASPASKERIVSIIRETVADELEARETYFC